MGSRRSKVRSQSGKILVGDCITELKKLPTASVDLVFADPPYGRGLGEKALFAAADGGWLAPQAIAVLEEAESSTIVLPPGFAELDRRAWGDTQVIFAQWQGVGS